MIKLKLIWKILTRKSWFVMTMEKDGNYDTKTNFSKSLITVSKNGKAIYFK